MAGTDDSGGRGAAAGATPVGDAVKEMFRVVAQRGREGVERAAADGRVRLELRQLKKDRDALYEKLGREVVRLVEAGEIAHPGLQKGAARVGEILARIERVEAGFAPGAEAGSAMGGGSPLRDPDVQR
jgi:hypothetical protein